MTAQQAGDIGRILMLTAGPLALILITCWLALIARSGLALSVPWEALAARLSGARGQAAAMEPVTLAGSQSDPEPAMTGTLIPRERVRA